MLSLSKLLLIVAMATIFNIVTAQSYHYSNGWNPGKRSSSVSNFCSFRSEVKTLIFKLIEDEVARVLSDQACYGGLSSLKNLLKKDIVYPPLDERK